MCSGKTFDLIRERTAKGLEIGDPEDNEYYTDCFIKDGILEQVYTMFTKKPTTESKFMYVYNLLKLNNKLPVEHIMTNIKDNLEACEIRNQGNTLLNKKSFTNALRSYNASVMVAVVGSEDYALALACRSFALYNLKKYEACIVDIHYALANKFPTQQAYELYDREVKCLINLGKIRQAKLKYKEFLSYLDSTSLAEDLVKKVKKELKELLHKYKREKNHVNNVNVLALLGSPNKNIPALSKFVKIKYSESMGRSLFVSTDVHPGDVIAFEKSYAGVLDYSSFTINCRNCFKYCINGIPCLKCTWVIYCSETCRIKSYESGHKYECEVLNGFLHMPSITNIHYLAFYTVVKSISKLGLDKYIDIIHTLKDISDPLKRGFNANGQYLSDNFSALYALEGNESKRTSCYLFMTHCYAAVIVSYLVLAGIEIPDHQLGKIGESVIHILCVSACNTITTTQPLEHLSLSVSKTLPEMPFTYLFLPVLSLINHSCDPNVVRQELNDGTVVLRVLQPIKKGSQIFMDYGFAYTKSTKTVRQAGILNQYCFKCHCVACTENWPLYIQLTTDGIFTTPKKITKDVEKMSKLADKLEKGIDDGLSSMKFINSQLETLYNTMKLPCVEYCTVQEAIKKIYLQTANKYVCAIKK